MPATNRSADRARGTNDSAHHIVGEATGQRRRIVRRSPVELLGSWRLVHWRRINADGTESFPFGEDAQGTLLYTDDGYMSAMMTAGGPAARSRGRSARRGSGGPGGGLLHLPGVLGHLGAPRRHRHPPVDRQPLSQLVGHRTAPRDRGPRRRARAPHTAGRTRRRRQRDRLGASHVSVPSLSSSAALTAIPTPSPEQSPMTITTEAPSATTEEPSRRRRRCRLRPARSPRRRTPTSRARQPRVRARRPATRRPAHVRADAAQRVQRRFPVHRLDAPAWCPSRAA